LNQQGRLSVKLVPAKSGGLIREGRLVDAKPVVQFAQ
jgi:hypothetical protein